MVYSHILLRVESGEMKQDNTDLLRDLDLAINRLDFYRVYKAVCIEFDLEMLLLFDLNNWPEERQISPLLAIVNSENVTSQEFDAIEIGAESQIFSALRGSILVKNWDLQELNDDEIFYGDPSGRIAITVPVHTASGRHYGFLATLQSDKFIGLQADILRGYLDKIFERFNELIIAPMHVPLISPRELEVIKWSAEGKTSVETAVILGLSEHTINSYTTKILQKLQVVNRAQMVAKAIRMGLIQ